MGISVEVEKGIGQGLKNAESLHLHNKENYEHVFSNVLMHR